jgi:signal transduction histidine kinase
MNLFARPEPLPRPAGWAVFGVFTALTVFAVGYELPDRAGLLWTAAAGAVVFGAVAVLGPQRSTAASAAVAGAAIVAICNGDPANTGWFALIALAGWCAVSTPFVVAGVLWLAITVMFVLEATLTASDPGWLAWIAGTALSVLASAFGRRQHELVLELHAAQEGLAQRAQAEERNRIARELHDVIAHSVSVIVVQAQAARRVLAGDEPHAHALLETIESTGRGALAELRRSLGLLRTHHEQASLEPQPSLHRLHALADQMRAVGLPVDVVIEGQPAELPPGVDLSAYRIVQEGLTNALKHAGPAQARVLVRYAPSQLEIEVSDDGTGGVGDAANGAGHGIVGMRERVALYGGHLETGRSGNGGYVLRARLPLGASA